VQISDAELLNNY